jgi:galactose oxidase
MLSALSRPYSLVIAALLLLASTAPVIAQTPDQVGQWSPVENWPCVQVSWPCNTEVSVPTHAMLLPNGKVFYMLSYGAGSHPYLWDSNGGLNTSPVATTQAPYNTFCAGHSSMADGNILITGGHVCDYVGENRASIFNWSTNTWQSLPTMNDKRWYPTNTTLANGDVLVVSGTTVDNKTFDKIPQVFQASSKTWRTLSSAVLQQSLYPYMYLAPNGKVFNAGPNPDTRFLSTTGSGAWSFVGNTLYNKHRDYGSSVMYRPGQVMIVGGGGDWHTGADPQPTNTAETIDLTSATPTWKWAAPMNFRRRQMNATILPDGTVLATGGTSSGGTNAFDDGTLAVHAAEVWNPDANTWTVLASNTVYRGYHSFALLLPDGTVLSAGGQVAGCNAEIFSPPYLFKGARPTISTLSFSSVNYGQTQFVPTPDSSSISKVTWLRLGSVTHAFNQDQRFTQLSFTKTTNGLNVVFPSDANSSPPGYYMLFILNSLGVPSKAKILRIQPSTGVSCPAQTADPQAVICTPADGATGLTSPVRVVGKAYSTKTVSTTQIYLDGVKAAQVAGNSIDQSIAMSAGGHHIAVKGWFADGSGSFLKSISVTVGGITCPAQTTDPQVVICTPSDGATGLTSPVHVVGKAYASKALSVTQIYVDGAKVAEVPGNSIDQSLTMSAGTHRITVKAWYSDGSGSFAKSINITVGG